MKRIISMLLALCMVLSCIPGTVSAHEVHDEPHQCQEMLLNHTNVCSEPLAEETPEASGPRPIPSQASLSRVEIPKERTVSIDAAGDYRPLSIVPRIYPWVSETEYGTECEGNLVAGRRYYFNYELYDANTGAALDDTGTYSYEVFLAIYDPYGDEVHSHTFTDDASWISSVLNVPGTYTFYWEVSGRFEGNGSFTHTVVSGSSSGSCELHCDASSVSLSAGDSRTVYVWETGTLPSYSYRWTSSNESVATCLWGEWTDDGSAPLTIYGHTSGSATITVYALDESDNTLDTIYLYVTVSNSSSCTISFTSASGTSNMPSAFTATSGSSVTIPSTVPTYFGYGFAYWQAEDSDGDTVRVYPGESFYVYESLTFEAYWYEAEELDIYDLYGSTSPMELETEIYFANQTYYFSFNPGASSATPLTYVFEGTGSTDNRAYLYDQSGTLLDDDDDSGSGYRQFRITRTFYDNETYYLMVRMYGSGTGTLPFQITCTTERPDDEYTVSFSAEGGSGAPSSITVTAGSTITIPSDIPTSDTFGDTFLCWVTYDITGEYYPVSPGAEITVNGDISFEAEWSSPEELDIHSLFGTDESMTVDAYVSFPSQVIYYTFNPGGSSELPITYRFEGISSEDNQVYLYDASGFQIGYDDDNGDSTQFLLEHEFSDNNLYYLMVRLYSSSDTGDLDFEVTCLTDPPVDSYTVTFTADGGSGAPASVSAPSGGVITIPSDIPVSDTFGVAFAGWEAETSAGDPITVFPGSSFTVTEDVQFHAVWDEPEELDITALIGTADAVEATASIEFAYQVRYYLITPGGSADFPVTYLFQGTGTRDSHVTLYEADGTEVARDNDSGSNMQFRLSHTFADNDNYYLMVRFIGTLTGDVPFQITCDTDIPVCTLTLDDTFGTEIQLTAPREGTVTVPDEVPDYPGKTFLGWGDEYGELLCDPGEEVTLTSDLTLYAYYAEPVVISTTTAVQTSADPIYDNALYWFSFVPSVSTSYLFQSLDSEEDNRIIIYTGNGDLVAENDNNGSDQQFRVVCNLTANTTYYIGVAVASTPNEFSFLVDRGYRITYNATGGSNAPSDTFVYHQTGGSLSEDIPAKGDYTFLGWALSADADVPDYEPGESISVTADTTLYALWQSGACEHSWTDATCEDPITCRLCGETVGEPLGHSWQDADCDTAKTCTRCGETEGEPLGHDYGAASCDEAATCSRCGRPSGGPLGHDWQDATCTAPKTCRRCHITEGRALGHDWQDPTCTDPYTCSRCSETVGTPLGHSWQDADCDTPKTCTRCGATEGDPLGHDWQDATCTVPKTCRRCSATEGDPLGHNMSGGTCTRCGYRAEGITRLAGSNRYATGFAIADQLKDNLGIDRFQTVVVAYGLNFPDALTGSYLASVKNAPILLTDPSVDNQVLDYLQDNLVPGGKIYILGGTSAVSQTFETAAIYSGYNVQRLKGAGRYETNLAILEEAGVNTTDEVLIATGKNYADSLSASATGLPMLLVDKSLTPSQKAFLQNTSKRFVILGGNSAVSAEIEAELDRIGEVTRVKGSNRYLTSVLIANKYFASSTSAVLAYAQGFPDGLCGGPLALSMGAPLILTSNESYEAADGFIRNISTGAVTGGTSRISDETVREIFDLSYDTPITRR